ncbi:MAG TPA: enoyl-CoA hydratase [Pseudomonadales bacterium]|nr:enoyl-CoA hydratase [Pseudomonadales bacterium]
MSEHILVSVDGGICKIQMHRPDKKNALTTAMYTAMSDALDQADADSKIRVVFITGTDDCFTSGNDVVDFMQNPPSGNDSPVIRFLRTISTFTKPIVAAVNGPAVGVGTTLLLHCDLIYAAESAVFQTPFVNLGLCPEAASSFLLPAIVGLPKATEILMLCEPFNAETALRYGLINDVLPDHGYQALAYKKAQKLAAQPAAGVRLTKKLLRSVNAEKVEAVMLEEGKHFTAMLRSPEAMEAMSAFLQKRKPDFSQFD